MSTNTQPGQLDETRSKRVKLDFTINIPTLLTIISMTAGMVAFGVRTYYEMDARTNRNTYDLVILQDRVRNVETQVAQARADTGSSVQALRGEIRVDLLEIKGTLKDLMLRQPGGSSRQLNEWSR